MKSFRRQYTGNYGQTDKIKLINFYAYNTLISDQSIFHIPYTYRGGAADFGFISITYHQYFFGLYKYILRHEISIFDRKNR